NDYLPSRIRVLSSADTHKQEPDIVTDPFATNIEFTATERAYILDLKDDNALDTLFRFLFIKQCNQLHNILPDLFEKTADYSELLLPFSFTDQEGVLYHLVHDIDEADFDVSETGQIEIIGWLYQYYISERRREIVDVIGKKVITKDNIPAATQLFTTDWVVRYMVDNSLGRFWLERHPNSCLADDLEYFVSDAPMDQAAPIDPREVTFFDPCMGSGHILVYAFDVLMAIYKECGYTEQDAAISILEYNLYGVDIDKRAYQLAYFAVMMKARSYNRHLFRQPIQCHLTALQASESIPDMAGYDVAITSLDAAIVEHLIDVFADAAEIGSLLQVTHYDYKSFIEQLDRAEREQGQIDLFVARWLKETVPLLRQLAEQAYILTGTYAVVCTNPPYMNKLDSKLKKYVRKHYKDYSRDLFSVFIYRNFRFCRRDGYTAFMTPNVWLYIKSYEPLRSYIIERKQIVSLIQMAKGAFYRYATVDVCSFVLGNRKLDQPGTFFILDDFRGDMSVQRDKVKEGLSESSCSYLYRVNQDQFTKLPGSPIVAQASKKIIDVFEHATPLAEVADPRQGIATTDNKRFLRFWHEVAFADIGFEMTAKEAAASGMTWFPLNKGGTFRKWYGNHEYVVNYQHDGEEIKANVMRKYPYLKTPDFVVKNQAFYFQPCISWSKISSGDTAFRYYPPGFIFEVSGCAIFVKNEEDMLFLFGFLNSVVATHILSLISPTLNYEVGHIAALPILWDVDSRGEVIVLVEDNIALAKADWDAFETSWNFRRHPLAAPCDTIEQAFQHWQTECDNRFQRMKENETTLNRIFCDVYELTDELETAVPEQDISV
ncbi:MAG TPA: BREX-1 system adenine-specific DNA-methyltransferase PglX, partial [Clostridiaceae bacterium]|nr:BREX-1 system adenine-specific DNA-methyltransferase PglX [Clostridiaceae bacterium]